MPYTFPIRYFEQPFWRQALLYRGARRLGDMDKYELPVVTYQTLDFLPDETVFRSLI